MKEIAEKAGVSRATVSRVISGHSSVTPEKRQKVMEWVRKLNYEPNKIAQSLVQSKSYLIGVIVPNLSNPFFSEIVEAIESEATRQGYSIIVCNTKENVQREINSINILKGRQVDGILIVPTKKDEATSKRLKALNKPLVIVTKKLTGFSSVSVSHEDGGAQIAKHFIDLGHNKVAFIGRKESGKLRGFNRELNSNGIKSSKVIKCERNTSMSSQKTYDIVSEYLNKNKVECTAFFAHNDLAACAAIHAFQDNGFRIPQDVIIAGFDNTFLASEIRPRLTSISQPTGEIGRLSIETLVSNINKEENIKEIILQPRLIIRESTTKVYSKNE